jgi:sortase A
MSSIRIWSRIGMVLLCAGVLLIAFVAFQLWGTAIYTDHQQGDLRNQLNREIGRSSLPLTALGSDKPGSTSTTSKSAKDSSSLPPVASKIAPTTPQPAVGQPIGLLAIPKLGLDDVVVQGEGEAQLQGGPGHYQGTSIPGQAGNAAIAGHRTTFAAPFYNLNELVAGDPIYVLTSQGLFRYDVIRSEVVSPDDNAVLDASTSPELTLTTCNPRYSASQRLVVVAGLDLAKPQDPTSGSSSPPTTSITPPTTSPTPPGGGPTSASGVRGSGSTSTPGSGGNVLPAVLWGIGTLLGAILLRVVSRRLPRAFRWTAYLVGVPLLLAALFVCFEHVSLALPASF